VAVGPEGEGQRAEQAASRREHGFEEASHASNILAITHTMDFGYHNSPFHGAYKG
jgi:hypothetical protein